ncbi:alpha/beta hydrolase [Novosphingobium sp. G106]|uniref:alpha/beta hydrolase n=1 Tax=Novosphingobium sp. G106 TaxID=2849500 RepID=UPI001C2DB60F|nr:alpha/beta hydrolase [Novosphingobium sp. G106]MBV1687175.1 alpha/beta hydrolase [Novosphingobium sp. G106]
MTQPFIRPDVRRFLDAMAVNPQPEFNDQLMAMIRQMPAGQMASADLPVGALETVRDLAMPGPAEPIALRLFDARRTREPGPVLVFFHGGGFVVGSIDTHAGLAAEMARQLDLPVISVEYRLAPEHRWPAAPDDAEAAARWIAENGASFEREFTSLVLCGDSAGGTLALVTSLALRDRPAALPVVLQVALYPKADSSRVYPSTAAFAEGFGLSRPNMAYYDSAYAADPQHWRHSPILAHQAGLPPTLVITAALDPLCDEGRAYAARAIEAGVQVSFKEMTGTIHGFATYRGALPSASSDLEEILKLARALMPGEQARPDATPSEDNEGQ